MSDDDPKSGLGAFLQTFSAPVLMVISVISSVHGFVKLFADKDAGLITIVSLAIGILLLFGICLYYARFWKPELQDKSTSAFAPAPSDQQVKAQAKKEKRRKTIRRSAIAGLVLIPILTVAGVASWQHLQNLPTKDIVILVADFEGPDPQSYRVTEMILENLENAIEEYSDVKVKALGKPITRQEGSKVAREKGEKEKAAIVIWGWYARPTDNLLISTKFEVLSPPQYLPELDKQSGELHRVSPVELEQFNIKIRPASEMAYLTLVTLGMSRYAGEDWDGAIDRFTAALEQVKGSNHALSQDAVFFSRAYSYQAKGKHDEAVADYTQALTFKRDYAEAYNNRGVAYRNKGNHEQAIADYTQALTLKRDYAAAYNNRGNAYCNKGDYERAIADYTQALTLKPNDAYAYTNRGAAYANKGDYKQAIMDHTKALTIKRDLAGAYNNRGNAYRNKGDYEQAIADYTQALTLNPDLAAAYYNRGLAYFYKKDFERAIADYTQALTLKSNYADAYYNRGTAYLIKRDYEQAIANYTKVLILKPSYAEAYTNRGVAYRLKDDKQATVKDFKKALELTKDANLQQYARQQLQKLGVK